MKTAVIGVAHVGPVTAACLARRGHDVVGMDDQRTIVSPEGGEVPFFEAGLLAAEGTTAGVHHHAVGRA